MKRTRVTLAGLLGLIVALAVAGCGGGGGGGSSNSETVVTGKVVDAGGATVPGATVNVENGPTTTALSQGSFRIERVAGGVRRVIALATVRGVKYSGSTQILAQSGITVTNANIQISPTDRQATLKGRIFDQRTGQVISRARVFLAFNIAPPAVSTTGTTFTLSSLVAFSDDQGRYEMRNIPIEDASGGLSYVVAASVPGYTNTRISGVSFSAGQTRTQDFGLGGTSNQGTLAPTNVFVQTFTQPNPGQRPYVVGLPSNSPADAYEMLRRKLSPAYARRVTGKQPARVVKNLSARPKASFGSYAVETDVFWDNLNQPNTLVGFDIYASNDTNNLSPYEFLQDPLANFYADFDPRYVTGRQYNFAVQAHYTDDRVSGFDPQTGTASAIPLGQLTLAQPSRAGQTLSNPVSIAWNRVSDISSYGVFVYNEFPTVNSQPIVDDENVSGSASSRRLSVTLSGGRDYYVVVAGLNADSSALTFSPIVKFHVP